MDFKFNSSNQDQKDWLNEICADFNQQVKGEDKISFYIDENKNRVVFYKSGTIKNVCVGNMVGGKLQVEQFQYEDKLGKKTLAERFVEKVKPFGRKISESLSKEKNIKENFKWDKLNKSENRARFLQNFADAKSVPTDRKGTADSGHQKGRDKTEGRDEAGFGSSYQSDYGSDDFSSSKRSEYQYNNSDRYQQERKQQSYGFRKENGSNARSSRQSNGRSGFSTGGNRQGSSAFETRPASGISNSSTLVISRNEYLNESLSRFYAIKEKYPRASSQQIERYERKEAEKILLSYHPDSGVKKAFRQWSRQFHPDKFQAESINQLSDSEKQKEVDKQKAQAEQLFKYVSVVMKY